MKLIFGFALLALGSVALFVVTESELWRLLSLTSIYGLGWATGRSA